MALALLGLDSVCGDVLDRDHLDSPGDVSPGAFETEGSAPPQGDWGQQILCTVGDAQGIDKAAHQPHSRDAFQNPVPRAGPDGSDTLHERTCDCVPKRLFVLMMNEL